MFSPRKLEIHKLSDHITMGSSGCRFWFARVARFSIFRLNRIYLWKFVVDSTRIVAWMPTYPIAVGITERRHLCVRNHFARDDHTTGRCFEDKFIKMFLNLTYNYFQGPFGLLDSPHETAEDIVNRINNGQVIYSRTYTFNTIFLGLPTTNRASPVSKLRHGNNATLLGRASAAETRVPHYNSSQVKTNVWHNYQEKHYGPCELFLLNFCN